MVWPGSFTIPEPTAGFPQIVAIMIAERAASWI
jgi:hypothetical protein